MSTIVLTGGGTAGHVTPNFAILKYLQKNFSSIYYIGSETGIERRLVKEKNIPYYSIPTVKLVRSFTLNNLKIPFIFARSVSEATKILKKLNPSVVFSKGGYVGLPVTIAAKKLKIPVIIHESDLTLGLANKIASRFSCKVLTTFKETANSVKNGEYVGAPIREELLKNPLKITKESWGFYNDLPLLLVIGGSSGSKKLNELIYTCASELTKQFNVIHIVGKNNLFKTNFKNYKQVEYADMQAVYPICDVCVSRAGSNTAFELIFNKIPTLFIPLPKGNSRGDQVENAKYFSSLNVSKTLSEQDANKDVIIKEITSLYKNGEYYKNNIKNAKFLLANKKIAEILSKY